MKSSRQFLQVPFILFDTAAISVIGVQCTLVYLMLMRFVWRGTHDDQRIMAYQKKGKLVAWGNQGRIAQAIGISRQSVCRHIGRLAEMGLVKVLRLGDNHRGYVLGEKVQVGRARPVERFSLELRLLEALGGHPKPASRGHLKTGQS